MAERRLTVLVGCLLLWAAVVFYTLIRLQIVDHRKYASLARARQEVVVEIPAARGNILDRTGSPLAMTVPVDAVHINPLKVDPVVVAGILSAKLRLDKNELYQRILAARENRRGYLVVARNLNWEEGDSLRRLPMDGIELDRQWQRHYPKGSLAAQVLGTVDFDGKGDAGVERTLDEYLRGTPGKERVLTDVERRGIDTRTAVTPKPGQAITLTIDERLQFIAERELAGAVGAHGAANGSVVVMNPRTGEILALASYPTYNPNAPPASADAPQRENHATGVPFEPGSVFKVITLSAALETTRLRPESIIDCGRGSITLFGRTIHEAHGGYGAIPMAQVLARSSNVGAIRIGLTVGQQNLYEYVRRFGFGQKTGIALPGESRGRLRPLSHWSKVSLASVSMGQEISVTTLQLAQAASVVANGGLLVRPRLVLKIGEEAVKSDEPVRVIRPETAITMRQMMEGVVLPGGSGYPEARLDGYSVGGKTGTAQIYDKASKHYTHEYNGSFMGFAPLTNPAVVVVVTLNGTHGNLGFGGRAAAPVFHAVAQEALRVMDVPKDLPEQAPVEQAAAKRAPSDLAIAGLGAAEPNILEEESDDEDGGSAAAVAGPTVPDFRGKSMRTVLTQAASMGLSVLPDGSGIARAQFPSAGAVLRPGERIRVRFVR
jgi:cell division protein FtsI (penicillin-binding protein 3)